jgi:metal-responsive CopG/Arc/MetJ family transcriptional regulator
MAVKKRPSTVRFSITLPKEQHKELERLSDRKRVSLAWVIRDAVEKYLEAQAPLFRSQSREG